MELILDETSKNLFNKYVRKTRNYSIKANDILNNKYDVHQGLDKIDFSKGIDWNFTHKISTNTYQLYLHTLNFTKHLVFEYLDTNNIKVIKKAKSIFEHWIKFNATSKEKYVWYDHTVSNRLTNLIFYQLNVPKKYQLDKKMFLDAFKKHLDFLTNDNNYAHNNHGIMMDKSIIQATIIIKDEKFKTKYIDVAKRRVENAILRDYSYMSTHLENSPDYHVMVTSWLTTIEEQLRQVKHPLKKTYQNKLANAIAFNGIISNYANQFPMLGDTSAGRSKVQKSNADFIDLEAGIAIFNDKNKKSTLVFNCGFQNLTHKHRDDLSFVFSINNEEIFVDSGKYNYVISDPYRKHMISPKAHSSIFVQDKTYPLNSGDNLSIKSFITSDRFKYVVGQNRLYEDVELVRHIILVDGDSLIVYDSIKSKNTNTYVQNFVLNDNIKCTRIDNKKYEINKKNYSYILQEHSHNGIGNLYYGKKDYAIISKKFNELIEVNRVEFKKKTEGTDFVTTFTPRKKVVQEISIENSLCTFKLNDEKFSVPLYK